MLDLSNPRLADLVALEGFAEPIDLVEAYITDSIVPAICTNVHCNASADLEPDQDRGFARIAAPIGCNPLSSWRA